MNESLTEREPGFLQRLGRAARRVAALGAKGFGLLLAGSLVAILAVRQPWPALAQFRPYLASVSETDLATERAADARTQAYSPRFTSNPLETTRTGLWHLRAVRAQEAWALLDARSASGAAESQVRVGVNDVFLDPGHPDLAGHTLLGLPDDAWAQGVSWLFNLGHGTGVMGLIAGRGLPGMTGVAPHALLLPFSRLAAGRDTSVRASLQLFHSMGARVANFSMAAPWQVADQETIDRAYYQGVLPVAGLYNRKTEAPAYPAAYSRVVAVSDVGPDDRALEHGWGAVLDVMAPGPGVLTTTSALRIGPIVFGQLYQPLCCNSAATAIVSGVAALLVVGDPTLSSAQIEKRLKLSARKPPEMVDQQGSPVRWHPRYGYGIVDAYAALTYDRTGPEVIAVAISPGTDGRLVVQGRALDNVADGGLEPGRERDKHLLGIPTSNVARVEFRLDEDRWQQAQLSPAPSYQRLPEDFERPFSFESEPVRLQGQHSLEVRAWDSAGNVGNAFAWEWVQEETR